VLRAPRALHQQHVVIVALCGALCPTPGAHQHDADVSVTSEARELFSAVGEVRLGAPTRGEQVGERAAAPRREMLERRGRIAHSVRIG